MLATLSKTGPIHELTCKARMQQALADDGSSPPMMLGSGLPGYCVREDVAASGESVDY